MDNIVIAIIDDEKDVRDSVSQFLSISGFEARAFSHAKDVLAALSRNAPIVIITDIRMPGMDGISFMKAVMSIDTTIPVIAITGHGDVQMAVEALRIGAYDFLEKPFDPEYLVSQVRRAAEARLLTLDNRALRRALATPERLDKIFIGQSEVMQKLREKVLDFSQSDDNILIEGEHGTGRTLIARGIHACSQRSSGQIVEINCAAFAEDKLEELIFDGDNPVGAFKKPSPITLILENIDQLPLRLQHRLGEKMTQMEDDASKPLRVLGIKDTMRIGRDMTDQLHHTIGGKVIKVPPLRDRGSDILHLFNHYLERYSLDYGNGMFEVTSDTAAKLMVADWPGNVRQLMKLAEKIALAHGQDAGTEIVENELTETKGAEIPRARPLKAQVEAFEQMLITSSLRRHKGSIVDVMEELALPRRTLNEKMTRYGLSRADFAK